MLKKVLVANCGEIALRVLHACRETDITTVVAHSETDKDSLYVKLADEPACVGPATSVQSYLNVPAIIVAAEVTGAGGIHPGYGFLTGDANFAEQVERFGSTFIGPRAETIRLMGDKVSAKHAMIEAGVPYVPSSDSVLPDDPAEALKTTNRVGYPVTIKASDGGDGRGMRMVERKEGLTKPIRMTKTGAGAVFGNPMVYIERYLQRPCHIETQVLADEHGSAIYLAEHDCSLQRYHQKVIEETPTPFITAEQREKIDQARADACKRIGYRGAGMFGFLYEDGEFFFIEMSTRIQAEYLATESIINVDIVQEQTCIAGGLSLQYRQKDIKVEDHAFGCRTSAEGPYNFIPNPGLIESCHLPGGFGICVDSYIYQGYRISPYCDSPTGKICVIGKTRGQAVAEMRVALAELAAAGIKTDMSLYHDLFNDQGPQGSGVSIYYLEH